MVHVSVTPAAALSFLAVIGTPIPEVDPNASYITAGATGEVDPQASYITAGATDDPNASYITASATGGGGGGGGDGTYVKALYPSETTTEAELVFQAGDIIEQLAPSDEYGWCTGRLNGVEGIYPANYVEEVPSGPVGLQLDHAGHSTI